MPRRTAIASRRNRLIRRTRKAKAGLLLLAMVSTLGARGTAEPPRYGARVDVVLRQARVLVRAPEGQSPWGLSASEFRVTEEGKAMEVAGVEEVLVARRAGATGAEALQEMRPFTRDEANRVGSRRWIVLFDSLNPGPVDTVAQLRKDLKRFARNRLGPEDEMSIAFVGTQKIDVSPFYDDPEKIAQVIDRQLLNPEDLPSARTIPDQQRSIDDRLSDIRRGNADPSIANAAPTPPPVSQQWLPFNARRFFGTDNLERRTTTSRYLKVVEDLGKSLRAVPGRKVLILCSAGFRGSDLRSDAPILRRFTTAVRNLMDSGTTVYTIDTNGLSSAVHEEVFSADKGYLNYSDPVLAESGLGADRLRDVSNDFFDQQGGSFLLALETGGEFFHGKNTFDQALEQIDELEAGYYLVSWYSSSTGKPGDFRKFEVALSRPGYRVAGPRGYFSEKPFARMDALEREADLLGIAEWGGERDEIPAEVRVDVFPDGGGGQLAVVSAVLGTDALASKGASSEAEPIDIVVAATSPNGGFSYWDRSSLTPAATATIAAAKYWHYQHTFPLGGPVGRVSLVIRENARGRILGRNLEVPALPARGFTRPVRIHEMKGLVRSGAGEKARDPFDFGGIHLAPAERSALAPGERLFVLLEAFGLDLGEEPRLEFALAGSEGERSLIPGPAPEQVRESRVVHPGRNLISILARVPTTDLEPGEWQFVVRAGAETEARLPFRIER